MVNEIRSTHFPLLALGTSSASPVSICASAVGKGSRTGPLASYTWSYGITCNSNCVIPTVKIPLIFLVYFL